MIRRARRDGREARGNEEREKIERLRKGAERGLQRKEKETKRQFEEKEGPRDPAFKDLTLRCSHCYFKSSGYDKLELKHQNLVFTSL